MRHFSVGFSNKYSANKYSIIYALLFVVFFQPRVLDNAGVAETFREMLQLAASLILFFLFISQGTIRLSRTEIAIFLFLGWGLLLTVLNEPQRIYLFFSSTGFKVFSIVVWAQNVLHRKCRNLIHYITLYFSILIWINAFLMLRYPNGLFLSAIGAIHERPNWLFGSKNQVTVFALLAILFLRLSYINSNKKFWIIATIILLLFETASTGDDGLAFMDGSTTAIIVLALFFVFCFFSGGRNLIWLHNRFKVRYIALFSIVMLLFVWYTSMNPSGTFGRGLNGFFSLFGKDISFSNRNSIWPRVYSYIRNKPIIGYGYKEFFFKNNGVNYSSYSFWGSIALYYGLIGVFIMLAALFSCDSKIINSDFGSEQSYFLIKLCLLMFLLVGTVNELQWQYVILLLELIGHWEGFRLLV